MLTSLTNPTETYEVFSLASVEFREWFSDLLDDTKLFIEFQIDIQNGMSAQELLNVSGTINIAEQLIALGKTTIVKS